MAENATDLIFVHGMYMNGSSWAPWVERAKERGLAVQTPSWPFHEGDPVQLREKIDSNLGRLNFGTIVSHYKKIIDALPQRPRLVGHSIGGLVVQKLLNDGYAHSAVAISSAPPQGIISFDPHFFRANFPHANPFAGNKPVVMTPERFHYTFCNSMDRNKSDQAFVKYVVPESRNIPRSTLTKQGKIDFAKEHAPLLMITGDRDHLTPISMVRKNFSAYRSSDGVTEFKEFEGRSHFICNQEGWEQVADFVFEWVEAH